MVADTHALIWYFTDPEMLSSTAVRALDGGGTIGRRIVVSAVSLIELVYIAESYGPASMMGRPARPRRRADQKIRVNRD